MVEFRPKGIVFQPALHFVFGYDFFISYSHSDGDNYPKGLQKRLQQVGFKVFLDVSEYAAGMDVRRETLRQVKKSRKLLVVARPGFRWRLPVERLPRFSPLSSASLARLAIPWCTGPLFDPLHRKIEPAWRSGPAGPSVFILNPRQMLASQAQSAFEDDQQVSCVGGQFCVPVSI